MILLVRVLLGAHAARRLLITSKLYHHYCCFGHYTMTKRSLLLIKGHLYYNQDTYTIIKTPTYTIIHCKAHYIQDTYTSFPFFSLFFNHHFFFPAQLVGGFYPQRSSGQAVVTGVVPSAPRYVSSFSSRIGFSIPTARRFSSNVSLTHVLALSAIIINIYLYYYQVPQGLFDAHFSCA